MDSIYQTILMGPMPVHLKNQVIHFLQRNTGSCSCKDHHENVVPALIINKTPMELFTFLFSEESTIIQTIRESRGSNGTAYEFIF